MEPNCETKHFKDGNIDNRIFYFYQWCISGTTYNTGKDVIVIYLLREVFKYEADLYILINSY